MIILLLVLGIAFWIAIGMLTTFITGEFDILHIVMIITVFAIIIVRWLEKAEVYEEKDYNE